MTLPTVWLRDRLAARRSWRAGRQILRCAAPVAGSQETTGATA